MEDIKIVKKLEIWISNLNTHTWPIQDQMVGLKADSLSIQSLRRSERWKEIMERAVSFDLVK